MLKKYYIDIYGRKNTIITAIRGKHLCHEIIIANNKKDAIAEALNDMYVFSDELWQNILTRRDVKVECELVSWLTHDEDETFYISDLLRS